MLRLLILRPWLVVIAVVGGAACASAPVPAGTPAPTSPREPERPAITEPSTPIPTIFTYAEGTSRYDLDQVTTIVVGADSAAPAADTVRTTAGLTLSVTGATTTITIDSMAISSVRDTMTPVRQLAAPVVVQAPVLLTVQQGTDSTALLSTCDSMEEAARVLAGDIHVPIPVVVVPAQTWRDSTTSTLCRGGIPLTVTRVSDFHISDVRSSGDSTVATVQRHTVLTLTGSGLQGSRRIMIRGDGRSETVFTYDLRGGRFLGSSGQSELHLGFETIQQTEQVVQRSTSSVRLRPVSGEIY